MIIEIKTFSSLGNGNVVEIAVHVTQGENTEKKYFKVLSSDFVSMRLSKGEINPELCDELERADRRCDAYLRAINILSFGANTARTLLIKLRRRGIDETSAKEAVEMLCDRGYLNEEEDLVREIERCIRKKWGKGRIMAHLHAKGYDEEGVSQAEETLSEVDFGEKCLELLCDKCDEIPRELKERQRLIASLSRYGYSMSEIKYAFSRFNEQ